MNLHQMLTGSKTITGAEQIHPNYVQTPRADFNTGHTIKMAILDQRYSDELFLAGKVGYSEANPVFFAETPASRIITQTPELKQTQSLKVGGCK
jgi:hypothetical protein